MDGRMDYTLGGGKATALAGYFGQGYGYADYPNQAGYGASFSKADWWLRLNEKFPSIGLSAVIERAWDNHHDIVSFRRR